MKKPVNCNLHERSLNGYCRFTEIWCEGYSGGRTDDEPMDKCKECKFNLFYYGEDEDDEF